jgi:hypothetical protein
MTGKPFTPIPAQDGSPTGGNFSSMAPFRTCLPISGGKPPNWWFPPVSVIPSVPAATEPATGRFSKARPAPLAILPSAVSGSAKISGSRLLPEIALPPEAAPVTAAESECREEAAGENPFKAAPNYSDEDLGEALAPIMQAAVRKAVYESERGNIDAFLEPMLRATVRRALAEYSPASRPFRAPGFMDRTTWRIQALLSSRSFEDILFEKTHRFQVEEVFLLDAGTLALVSFASCDPARHSAARRIENSAKRIAMKIRDEKGDIRRSFEHVDGRNVISECGEQMLLVAIVRGQPNDLILADLSFSLRRIEEHFRERFTQAGSALMHALQPFLEDCLLIQAPGSAA